MYNYQNMKLRILNFLGKVTVNATEKNLKN